MPLCPMSRQTLYDDGTFHHTTISSTIFMQLGQAAAMACFSSRQASFNPTKQKWSYERRNLNHKRHNKKHKRHYPAKMFDVLTRATK